MANRKTIDRKVLIRKYWLEEKSLSEIAVEFDCSAQTVLNVMKKFGIERRSCRAHTNKTKAKQSKAKTGNKNPMYGKKRPEHSKRMKEAMQGRKISEVARRKMSLAKKGLTGSEHNRWIEPDKRKGDLNKNIRRLKEMTEWRTLVFERDSYLCQMCGNRGLLNADHIKPLAALILKHQIKKPSDCLEVSEFWDIDNGRTLCIDCHRSTETYGGKTRIKHG